MRFRKKPQEEPSIEIAPLIDVVFLLLLFFMVTTRFITLPGIKLTLPGVNPAGKVNTTGKVEVQVTAAGDIFVDGNPVNEKSLGDELERKQLDPESGVVVVLADKEVSHGKIVTVLDTIRGRNIRKVVIGARWKGKDKVK